MEWLHYVQWAHLASLSTVDAYRCRTVLRYRPRWGRVALGCFWLLVFLILHWTDNWMEWEGGQLWCLLATRWFCLDRCCTCTDSEQIELATEFCRARPNSPTRVVECIVKANLGCRCTLRPLESIFWKFAIVSEWVLFLSESHPRSVT